MRPSRRLVYLLAGWAALGVVASFVPPFQIHWMSTGLVLALAVAVDAIRVRRVAAPSVRRTAPPAFSMGVSTPVELSIANPSTAKLTLSVFDHHPPRMRAEDLPVDLEVPAGSGAELVYRLRPETRGRHRFGFTELRLRSPWGLLERSIDAAEPEDVRVYPNFRAGIGYELLAVENRTGALGIRRHQRRGEGLDFHQLREYRAGDSLRQIDWKATARLRKTISREYQDERDQQIVFLLDCGQRMHSKDGDRSHFDAALDAVLLTAHVALRQGDAFGLMTFGGEARWIAPRKGIAHLNLLLNKVYDIESGPRVSDYAAAARDLALRVRKRVLVVLLSNVRDEDVHEIQAGLRLLSRRHLVLLASLREEVLGASLRRPIHSLEDALRVTSVRLYLEQRRLALRRLSRSGAILLDSEADGLPVALANRYLDVKAAGIL